MQHLCKGFSAVLHTKSTFNAAMSLLTTESTLEQKQLKQDGYTIHYFTCGNPAHELIVFLHPAFADHRCFDQQVAYFSRAYRVVTIDLLGHGLSSVEKAKDKIDHSIYHIEAILGLEGYSKVHLVSVSMGSLIAQYYALHFPDKVASLTILGGYDINADNKELARAQRLENVKWILKALFSMTSFRKYVAEVSVLKPESKARFYEMATRFTRKSFTVMAGLGKVLQPRAKLKRTYPVLIISGDKDLALALRMSKNWHESEPQSSYFLMKDAGHCANMDKPDEFNELVMKFIGQSTMPVS